VDLVECTIEIDHKLLESFGVWYGEGRRSVGPIMWKMKKNYN